MKQDVLSRMSPPNLCPKSLGRPLVDRPQSATPVEGRFVQARCTTHVLGGGGALSFELDELLAGDAALSVAVGASHFAVVTVKRQLHTWHQGASIGGGDGHSRGQLGHGNTGACRRPRQVQALANVSVRQCACGRDFTFALTEDGQLFHWGSVLGCEESYVSLPTPVLGLSGRAVIQVVCGDFHALALTGDYTVFAWGSNDYGLLGVGDEDARETPALIEFPDRNVKVVAVAAGSDCSLFLGESGVVYATGSNEYNKVYCFRCKEFFHPPHRTSDYGACIGIETHKYKPVLMLSWIE